MSSSNPRGHPPNSRYNDRNEYTDYGKSRRKNFYSLSNSNTTATSASTPAVNSQSAALNSSLSRRDYKSNGPGSSSLTHSKDYNIPTTSSASASHKSFGRRSLSGGPNIPPNGTNAASTGESGAYSASSSSYYYPGYGNYSNDYYRGDSWRSERKSSGDSRVSTSNKPISAGGQASLSGSGPNLSYYQQYHRVSNGSEFRSSKDRYDSYVQDQSHSPTSSISSSSINTSKWKTNRSSLTNSLRYSSKDRIRGSGGGGGGGGGATNAFGTVSGSNSVPIGSGKSTRASGGPAAADTYYPSRYSSVSSLYSNPKLVDRYSSLKRSYHDYSKPRDDKRRFSSKYESRKDIGPGNRASLSNAPTSYPLKEANITKEEEQSPDSVSQVEPEQHEEDMEDKDEEELDEDLGEEDNEENDEEDYSFEPTDLKLNEDKPDVDNEQILEIEISTKVEPIPKVEEVKVETKSEPVIIPPQPEDEDYYPDRCRYPLNKLETEYEALKKKYERETLAYSKNGMSYLKYSLAKPISNLEDFPFFRDNFKVFIQVKGRLIDSLKDKNAKIHKKRLALWIEYSRGLELWEQERIKMDQQLRVLHPSDDEMRREIDSGDLRKQNQLQLQQQQRQQQQQQFHEGTLDLPTVSSRRSRRHGDLVTTEAEFQEILLSLGQEEDEHPLVKAERVAAPIPDLILDPVERREIKFMDSNNIVHDKAQWAQRLHTSFLSNFSEREHELFCEGFCMYPKRFGAISRHMGGIRTSSECVDHYYITKKSVNYKQLLIQFKKRSSKKRRGKSVRSRNVSQTPASTPINEESSTLEQPTDETASEFENTTIAEVTPPVLGPSEIGRNEQYSEEELFTETGRRKRAAAPVFDKSKDKQQPAVDGPSKKKQRSVSRRDEPIPPNGSIDTENSELSPEITNPAIPTLSQGSDYSGVDNRRKIISSYWSITEKNAFPKLLEEYGTKWTTIADHLTTKTATMVRNYYQRKAEKNGWNVIAEEANKRLAAKFAAVLNAGGDEAQKPSVQSIPIHSMYHANDIQGPGMIQPQQQPQISTGTFQHIIPSIANVVQQPIQHHHEVSKHVGPSISNLLADDSALYQSPIQLQTPHQRSSIMNLLNNDSSPVKVEPQQEQMIPTAAPPAPPAPHRAMTNLRDLLNAPSSPAEPQTESNIKRGGIANLLSADPQSQ